jgi:hypothetical protein
MDDLTSEFGTNGNVRFNDISTMHYENADIVLCKCGNHATCGIIGKEAYISFCNDCSPFSKYSAKFVYKPPNQDGAVVIDCKPSPECIEYHTRAKIQINLSDSFTLDIKDE